MVIWLIGISGAGKSTLAGMLKNHYETLGRAVYVLDGDMVRGFYDGDLGYGADDRRANIKRIMLAAHVLDECGITAIVANISPFDDLRLFARKKIKNYNQIYLKKDLAKSMAADVKGVYRDNLAKTELIGREIPFDEPTQNDIVIEVDRLSEEESLEMILAYIKGKYGV